MNMEISVETLERIIENEIATIKSELPDMSYERGFDYECINCL